jgi:hypothetical protein
MRNNISTEKTNNYYSQRADYLKLRTVFGLNSEPIEKFSKRELAESFLVEAPDNLISFIECLGLARDPNMVVLPADHYFYYDAEEMKHVHTVINLMELNKIRQMRDFITNLFCCMPPRSNLIGCYVDHSKHDGFALNLSSSNYQTRKNINHIENGIISESSFLNKIYSFMDSRINNRLSTPGVNSLLSEIGFKMMHMVELSGITYFHTVKPSAVAN